MKLLHINYGSLDLGYSEATYTVEIGAEEYQALQRLSPAPGRKRARTINLQAESERLYHKLFSP